MTAPGTLRSDARRNRDRIVAAAQDAFAEHGLDCGVELIARRAGVGMGTLYRRFPTKEQLVLAIFEQRLDALAPAMQAALAREDGWAGFTELLQAGVAAQAGDQGFMQMVAERLGPDAIPEEVRARFLSPLETLLERARAAGQVRPDVTAADLPYIVRMATSVVRPTLGGDPPADWERYVGLLLDGLRPPA
jgi:AcrR family transcriptional regulator